MADNVTVDNATNGDYSVSTDDAGASGQVQRFKLTYSADGDATHVPADADGLLVNLGANNDVAVTGTVPVIGTVSVSSLTGTIPVSQTSSPWGVNGTVAVSSIAGTVAVSGGAAIPVTDNSGSLTVDGSVTANPTRPATGTTSQVADNAASVTILAANSNRLGASITNDSTARLYLKCGTTATTSDYTVSLMQHDHWEVPFGYTGKIDGIWASDPNTGSARVTEYTA